jgi:CO/xanthine dehydrogenase FAD-binding subunit
MKAAPFEYVRAHSLEEACAALDDDAMIIAGGQTLVPLMAMRLARPSLLVDINDVAELKGISAANGAIEIKACTRQADAMTSDIVKNRVPLLAKALPFVGHAQTRNRGTVGGSVALGDPSAEIPLVATALDARIELRSTRGARVLEVRRFFQSAMETARTAEECLTIVFFPVWHGERIGVGFQEVAERQGDFAVVSACAQLEFDDGGTCRRAAVAVGGASPAPVRVEAAEIALVGGKVEDKAIAEAVTHVADAIDPSSDGHATADYRRRVAPKLVARAIAEARA